MAAAHERQRLCQAKVELIKTIAIERPRRDQLQTRGAIRARRQVASKRRRDLGVGCRVRRGDLRSRETLVRRTRLQAPPRQRIHRQGFYVRLKGWPYVAERLRLRRSSRTEAEIVECVTGIGAFTAKTHAAADDDAVPQAGVGCEIDAVIDVLLLRHDL